MARKVVWAAPALEALDDIAAYIALDNPRAAAALAQRALASVDRLTRFPSSGRWVPEVRDRLYRELIVHPCRLIYRRVGDDVLIVHVCRSEALLKLSRLS